MQKLIFPELDDCASIAVAVSGGADSMALLHQSATYAKSRKKELKVLAITVDHALRANSAAEAKKVATWVSKFPNVTHAILKWEGKKPKTGTMESAREARYALMADACKKQGIKMLAIAHHADDQAETFFMRLAHGSGLDGLAGMKTISAYDTNLTLYRPLLNETHADLVAYCRAHKIKWVEDPTNANPAYARTRLRDALAKEGLDAKRLAVTQQRLARASAALKTLADEKAKASVIKPGVYDLHQLKAMPFEIALRIVRVDMDKTGRGKYGPRLERLEDILAGLLAAPKKTKATLAGCMLTVSPRAKPATLEIAPESV